MKNFKKALLVSLVVLGLQFGLVGCLVGVGGRRGGDRGGGSWYHDGRWMDGGRGGFGHGDIHPPGFRR
jgi:hypothetical protein